jgi:hypothetical protein
MSRSCIDQRRVLTKIGCLQFRCLEEEVAAQIMTLLTSILKSREEFATCCGRKVERGMVAVDG